MPDRAFRYFLPAYLLCNVLGQLSNANPVFHLFYGLTPEYEDKREDAVERFALFSLEEHTVIVAFLRAILRNDISNYDASKDITATLDSYWLPALAHEAGSGDDHVS